MREIKGRTPVMEMSIQGESIFSHFEYWSVVQSCFNSSRPGMMTNNYKFLDDEFFTGLKDKNGKDIYEGDIVKLCRSLGYQCNKGKVGKIEHDPVELGFLIVNRYALSRLTCPRARFIEVIGSIHENKDLLEENK